MTLRVLLHDILAELDPDGGGFRTSEAADLLYAKVSDGCADIPLLVERLARRGAREEVASFRPERAAAKRVAADVMMGQRDMADVTEGFDHWVTDIAALDSFGHVFEDLKAQSCALDDLFIGFMCYSLV